MGRLTPLGLVLLLVLTSCYDDPTEPLRPEGRRESHTAAVPSGSGIYNGAETFVAGNPMRNFAGGPTYNYGYYSDGPDPADGINDPDQARIEIPHDPRIQSLTNFAFETWVHMPHDSAWQGGIIAMNSRYSTNSSGSQDFGYFQLEYFQYSPGRVEFEWHVSSYGNAGWSSIRAEPPPLDPDTGAILHLVGVHENNIITLYINGRVAAAADISSHTGLGGPDGQFTTRSGFRQDLSYIFNWNGDTDKPLMIGGARCTQAADDCYSTFHGSIGESAFYRRALSAAEVLEHYQVGTATAPASPDTTYHPYRDLVLSDSAAGYWRHREAELHGLTTIDGQQVLDASGGQWHGTYRQFSSQPQVSVTLTCPPSATRGEEIACFANVSPTEAEVLSWRFEPDSVTIHPRLGPVPMAEAVVDDSSATMGWRGPLVLPGQITIAVAFDSVVARDSLHISVNPRPWTTDSIWYGRVDTTWAVQSLADDSTTWLQGENVHVIPTDSGLVFEHSYFDLIGFDPSYAQPADSTRFRVITGGPNAGYMYIEQYPVILSRGYKVNRFLTQTNPVRDIRIRGRSYNRWDALIRLGWGNPGPALQHTIEHESFGAGVQPGHQEALLDAVLGEHCGNAALRMERMAGASSRVREELALFRVYVIEFMTTVAGHLRVYGHHGSGSPIVLRQSANNAQAAGAIVSDTKHAEPGTIRYKAACEYGEFGL